MTSRTKNLADQLGSNGFAVEWPRVSISGDQADADLGPPIVQLVTDLGIKGTAEAEGDAGKAASAITGTPASVAIIEAGATAASKGWALVVAALGGASAFWAAVSSLTGAAAIAAAIVVAACALGVALIIYGDVRARGQGAAAQYQARAMVATAFLRQVRAVPGSPADAAAAADGSATRNRDGLSAMRHDVRETRAQVADVSDRTRKILDETDAVTEDLSNVALALAVAHSGRAGIHVVLRNGRSGRATSVSRSVEGQWMFRLDKRDLVPISEIAGFGE